MDAVMDEPARKRLKLDIRESIRDKRKQNRLYHQHLIERIIKKHDPDGRSTLRKNLLEWYEAYFLEKKLYGSLEILRVPNFIFQGNQMRPIHVDASQAYFTWFSQKSKHWEQLDSILENLNTICSNRIDPNGSERGHAFETLLSSKLTLNGIEPGFTLYYQILKQNQKNSFPIHVKNRMVVETNCPPNNFRNYPEGTLLTHTGGGGGEARVDLIYFGPNEVIFMEATVGNYRTTKMPSGIEEAYRTNRIIQTLEKWLGKSVYKVAIESDCRTKMVGPSFFVSSREK